ncbi:MAG: bifunctional ornithine acetyltransferase/N-acetylglutamate synthase [Chloroflexi bacterium]|nr:bifunctional ornithine acetyltransferase/N-acetylglutamate synthase [Chloroflexota bacterium]|tara:strand:+ start:23754 stop:24968 length:1215 start_codon:yes stop_codon:yes gene_type:complete
MDEISVLPEGSVTSPKGYKAGSTYAGLRTYSPDKRDLGILYSDKQASVAGVFTTNLVRSHSVTLCERHISSGLAQAIIVNSGVANACVGMQGLKDAEEMASNVSSKFGIAFEDILVCSTGMIGVELPMGLLRGGIANLNLDNNLGHEFARAILTTDKTTKEIAVSFEFEGQTISIGGCAKGSGMIHPNMATMLAFITTDANISSKNLQVALKEISDSTFNMISVDGDTSTNDTVLVLSNGASSTSEINPEIKEWRTFLAALHKVCEYLAKSIARDGEGASKLIEVIVDGASNLNDARLVARSISSSSLVKTAVHGNDPNWGRIMMAVGKSGAKVDESSISLFINEVCIMEGGLPVPYFREALIGEMRSSDVSIRVQLGLGDSKAIAWGCNMSEEYVTFNSAYTT